MNTMSAGDNDPAALKRVLAGARKPAPVAPPRTLRLSSYAHSTRAERFEPSGGW